jgi:hypothetical protein
LKTEQQNVNKSLLARSERGNKISATVALGQSEQNLLIKFTRSSDSRILRDGERQHEQVNTSIMESLILAQDERWRRA